MPAHDVEHAAEGDLVRVAPETEAVGRDPADGIDGRRLEDQEPGTAEGEMTEVDEVPVARVAVDGRVLAHRRDHDPVRERQASQVDRLEECAGRGLSRWGLVRRAVGRP